MQFVSRTLGSIWQCAPILQLLTDVFSAMVLCSSITHESSIWVDFMSLVGWTGVKWQPSVTESHRCLIWKIGYLPSIRCSLHEVSWIYVSLTMITSVPFIWTETSCSFRSVSQLHNHMMLDDMAMWVMNWEDVKEVVIICFKIVCEVCIEKLRVTMKYFTRTSF
jgi:hypothetical protein